MSSCIWNLGFFPNDARINCPFVLTAFTGWSSERCPGIGFLSRGDREIGAKNYAIVNVADLNRFNDGDRVTLAALIEAGIVRKELDGLKVLGNGELTKKITVEAKVFSATAKEKIEACGGAVEVI